MAGGKRSATKVHRAQRTKQFLSWRCQGLSIRAIADRYNETAEKSISHTTVQNDINRELKTLAEQSQKEASYYREIELQRLNMAMSAIAAKVAKADIGAVTQWVKISESRRKLLGLDAPVQLQVQQALESEQEQFISLLESALDAETFAKVSAAAVAIAEASAAAETN